MQSPGLDPLTALGIEARTDTERKKYAEQWVRQEFARTEKELKFQREVDAAWQRLGVLSVNMGNAAGIAHDTGGRLALFVKAKDCVPCDARLAAVLADNRPVDIYLVDSHGNDSLLRDWAREHHIPVDKVRARQITLNHDGGRWMKFGNGLMPVVLQQGKTDGLLPRSDPGAVSGVWVTGLRTGRYRTRYPGRLPRSGYAPRSAGGIALFGGAG